MWPLYFPMKSTSILCLEIGDTGREAPKTFSPVSRGEPHRITAAMAMQIGASQALLGCLSYWPALSLPDLHTTWIVLKYIHKCYLKQSFSLPASKEHLEMINLSLHLAQTSSGRNSSFKTTILQWKNVFVSLLNLDASKFSREESIGRRKGSILSRSTKKNKHKLLSLLYCGMYNKASVPIKNQMISAMAPGSINSHVIYFIHKDFPLPVVGFMHSWAPQTHVKCCSNKCCISKEKCHQSGHKEGRISA